MLPPSPFPFTFLYSKLDSTKAEFKMIRRELFTTARMKQMQLDNQQKEFKFKDNIAVIRRDELNAFTSAAEERVENKRYQLASLACQNSHYTLVLQSQQICT